LQLRHVAEVRNSNVDKIVQDDERPVRLCNYVDVYKNDFIDADMPFMVASATPSEIDRFRLRVGDVILTKDSEDRHDIGVPAYVRFTAPDLVCGYHLSMVRAKPASARGDFLFWALQAKPVREAFSNASYGITRYGLSLGGMKSVRVPLPDLDAQKAIADFLDRETARIDRLIEKRDRFDGLLLERRVARVSETVLGGAAGRHEGPDQKWLTGIPGHWRMERAKFYFRERNDRSEEGQEELLTVSHITGVTRRSEKDVNMFLSETNEGYKIVQPDDVVINTMWAWMGAMGVSRNHGIISPSYGVYRPVSRALRPGFTDLMLRSKPFIAEATRRSKGIHSSRLRLYSDAFLDMRLPIPPMAEQDAILADIGERMGKEDALLRRNEQAKALLREFRAALITAAVTGQIDVAEWQQRDRTDTRLDQIEKEIAS
jgi:type I restriction enzyme S subunit